MKKGAAPGKWIRLFLLALVWCLLGQNVLAASKTDELKGEPKLMVTAAAADPAVLEAGGEATLTVTIRNTNGSRYIKNAIFSFSEMSGEIIPVGSDSIFVAKLDKGAEFAWSFRVRALPAARSGIHTAEISLSYEDNTHLPHMMSSTIYLELRQPVRLYFEEPEFPARVLQGETPRFSLTLMNLGKSPVYNALLSFDIEGLANGGSVLVGTIEPGESKEGLANFRVDSDKTGLVAGRVTLTYEDDRGTQYETEIPVKTTIGQRVVQNQPAPDEKAASGILLSRWTLPAAGFVMAILIIAAVLIAKRRRKRKADEARL